MADSTAGDSDGSQAGVAAKVSLDRPLYPLALAVLRLNAAPAVFFLSVIVGLNMIQSAIDDSQTSGARMAFAPLRLCCLVLMAHAAYRVLLTGGVSHGVAALRGPQGQAPLRFLGIMLAIFMPMVILGAIATTPGGPAMLGGWVFIGFFMFFVLAYGFMLAILGTALPELADRGEAHLKAALRRGIRQYRVIARGLVYGPGLFGACHGGVLVLASLVGLEPGGFDAETGRFNPGGVATLFFLSLGHLYSVTLAAVVLTRAYRAEPEPEPISRR